MDLPLPLSLRSLAEEVEDRLARTPTHMNEYGFDPFGASLQFAQRAGTVAAFLYRNYFRVETHGIEKVPDGRVLLIGNHAGNTLPIDGAMLSTAMLLEAEPLRFVRLLEHEEAIMVFPEGSRGFIKPFSERYKLQRFGTGFVRLALQTKTPIVPVGIVGSEEQSPGLIDAKRLARLIGAPSFPVTWFFPWLGLLGFLPLPVKDQIALLLEEGLAQREGWFR